MYKRLEGERTQSNGLKSVWALVGNDSRMSTRNADGEILLVNQLACWMREPLISPDRFLGCGSWGGALISGR